MGKYNIFPYALFCAGCDFHHSETIATRVEAINCFKPNHYLEITNNSDISELIEKIITPSIDINKWNGEYCASTFIKSHKWDLHEHGTSKWNANERLQF